MTSEDHFKPLLLW